MEHAALSLQETQEMMVFVSREMVNKKDFLTQADKAIGDGDHGIGMARGFTAVGETLGGQEFSSLGEMFKTTGTVLLSSIGGAAGAVFGTLFRAGGKGLHGQDVFDSRALSCFLSDGLEAVKARGGAKLGDKTMVDALEPAALKAKELESAPLGESLFEVSEAARQGMENTKEMIAGIGKAKTLGERSLGHPDPGAVSTHLLLSFMHEYLTRHSAGG